MYIICKYHEGIFQQVLSPIYAFEKRALQDRDHLKEHYGCDGWVVYEVQEVSDMINYERGD
jgi:hypothetical protein